MANEYLTRTPTSTGNRRVFTWSGWVKKNEIEGGFGRFFESGAIGDRTYFTYTEFDEIRFTEQASSANRDSLVSNYKLRDPSSLCHVMIAVNSTLSNEDDRVKIYINGSLINNHGFSTDDPPGLNVIFQHNESGETQYIGNSANQAADFMGSMSDVFHIDGQALTPDVFGFHKEGKGYQSSGSTRATDFGPGQWIPKAPRTIKSEINRRGGFGVNGYYLPMNDSSNFGADFHCAPNSIIKLKGEDLPQPRNGAPTTTDAYVSELRTDPYAANLVLAVPGASTSTGPELVTNGDFSNGTTGWTLQSATGTLSVVLGELFIEYASTNGAYCTQIITTEVGKSYKVSVTSRTTTTNQPAKFSIGTASNTTDLTARIDNNDTTNKTQTASFVATSTTTFLTLGANYTSDAYFDNVSVREEAVPLDYSADIKGSGTNKTLTVNGGAGIADIPSYYGSAMQFSNDGTNGAGNKDMINVPTSSDFVFNGDVTIECWMYVKSTPSTSGAFLGQWQSSGGTNRNLMMYLDTSNQVTSYFNSSNTNYDTGASPALTLNQWHHIVTEKDGSNFRLYLNGVCAGINTNTPTAGNTAAVPFTIGAETESGGTTTGADYGIDGYIQDVRVYNGVAKYKGGFDVPKPYTPVGIESWRQSSDTCNGNNFATLNSISGNETSGLLTFTSGNLTATTTNSNVSVTCNVGMSIGKWYWEYSPTQIQNFHDIGISSMTNPPVGFDDGTLSASWRTSTGQIRQGNTDVQATGLSASAGDIVQIAFNADTRRMWVGVNGSYYNSGDPAAGTDSTYQTNLTADTYFFAASYHGSGTHSGVANFGQNPTFCGNITAGTYTDSNGKGLFKYQPPSGFLALCEDNLPTPAIADPGDHFKTVLWTGDYSTSRSITGVGFQPDFVWQKERNSTSWHNLVDSIRGSTHRLFSNETTAESSTINSFRSFDSDGFSIGDDGSVNQSGIDNVAWCWKAGGAAVSNSDGSITTQVSVNQTAGFSIVTGTQTSGTTTFGHGLSQAPDFIITKQTNGTTGWYTWHKGIPITETLRLDNTNASFSFSHWVTEPTDSVFSMGSGFGSGEAYVCYCWHEVEGFSKFGSYIGNGSVDGPFVYCGFKPAFLMIKRTDTTGEWWMYDSSRGPINPNPRMLMADNNLVEQEDSSSYLLDFLSNGFKWRSGLAASNGSGGSFIFMAFAESPFQTANAK